MNSTDTSDFTWDNGSCVVDVTLKDDEYVTIDNIPFGVTYRVDEIEPKSDDMTPSKEFLCKMAENLQVDVPPSRKACFVRCRFILLF